MSRAKGIRVNDPNNPGRTYFSGKGLDFPSNPDEATKQLLLEVKDESNKQTAQMVENLNDFLKEIDAPFDFIYEEIKDKYAEELVRERHIAKAVRREVFETFSSEERSQNRCCQRYFP